MEPVSTLLRSPLLALSGPILVFSLVALFWMRSGSIYSLLERVWRLIAGKAEVSDATLKAFIQDSRDIEKFRFMYGLRVETIEELHKLLEWLKRNSISISSAQRARRWIDAKSSGLISSPPKHYQLFKMINLLGCMFVAMVFAEVSTSQSALLQMKKSKTWFLADTKIVKGLTDDWVIEKTQCSADIKNIRAKGFTESETMTICEALKDDTLKQLVSDTVKTQRLFGILFGVGVLIWMIVIVFQMASAKAAIDINRAVTNTDSLSSESTGSVSQ